MGSWLIFFLSEKRSEVAGGAGVALFATTLILRYGFGLWWPWGIAMAAALAIVAIVSAAKE